MTRAFSADRRELTALRLAAQGISTADATSPADVVGHLVAMQAQDFAGAMWSIGLRMEKTTHGEIESAIANRELVRSWPMRGTLHFVLPEDLGWILTLTRDRIIRGASARFAERGLSQTDFRRAEEIAVANLSGGRSLTRNELQSCFDEAGIATAEQRGYSILWYLSQMGVLVFGPVQGKQHTFVLFDEWVTSARRLEGDEALGEFARRYFTSHGPATVRDFAWWSSLTLTDARRGLAMSRDSLDELIVADESYFLAKDLQPAGKSVFLLPGFDEYVLGYQDRSAPLSDGIATRIVPGNNGVFLPTIVVDGEIVGTWRKRIFARSLTVELSPESALSPTSVARATAVANRFGRFLGKQTDLSIDVGPQNAPEREKRRPKKVIQGHNR
jgi:Winged helix DNA-binding domain